MSSSPSPPYFLTNPSFQISEAFRLPLTNPHARRPVVWVSMAFGWHTWRSDLEASTISYSEGFSSVSIGTCTGVLQEGLGGPEQNREIRATFWESKNLKKSLNYSKLLYKSRHYSNLNYSKESLNRLTRIYSNYSNLL